ncbi:beta-glucosidase [uncultured Enterovirga sp.]|uniref:beta-glucosidase n=1 Tax=uncultured Enterovirga sp. TaxID=2026352 RepID=UPI0035C9CB18
MSFASFFLGGFECSCHTRPDANRLDLLRSTGHDRFAASDYRLLIDHDIRSARDGIRWHLIEAEPGRYDWSSLLPMAHAARQVGMQVVWDLCHYGLPTHIDIWSPHFPDRFARFAREAALVIADISGAPPTFCAVNEISFWSWAGGEVGRFGPCAHGRGGELKRQLVRACIAATRAVRDAVPGARFICAEPAIHIDPGGNAEPDHVASAEFNRLSQFEAIDLLLGRKEPELGGSPDVIDVIGLNFYPDNQWYYGGLTIPLGHHAFRPLSVIMQEWWGRFEKPLLLAETGAEGSGRASWLHYVCGEVREASRLGVPCDGVCIYPILEYQGWENGRACATGLLSGPDETGTRTVYGPLATELGVQRALVKDVRSSARRHAAPKLSEAA